MILCHCDEKTFVTVEIGIAQILPFMACITRRPVAEPKRQPARPIGNHLKNSESEFRIINHSFTPGIECWRRTRN